MGLRRYPLLLFVALLALTPLLGSAQGTWLDGGQTSWNAPGMEIPAAPSPATAGNPQCEGLLRPAETAEDEAVTTAGWRLYSAYQRGWGVTLVGGFLNFDAMCRPVPYQQFVFVDGVFAGTLAPEAMYPRTDGALTDAHVSSADRLYAVYDRYAPSDALCCPSEQTTATYVIERTAAGPVVTADATVAAPQAQSAVTPAAPDDVRATADLATFPVCAGLGGDALTLVEWTTEEIADYEESTGGSIVRPHPETGTCVDPAGLPVLRSSVSGFSWVCSLTFDGLWYGPIWTLDRYLAEDDVPPDPASGGCPLPRDPAMPPRPDEEQAAATAVYLSQLEAAGDLDTLYEWLHPDAQAVVPEPVVAGWYDEEWLPRGPGPISVSSVAFGPWTWGVTGVTYPRAAEIAYEQPFADGSVVEDVVRLVQDDQGVWRWFFGRDRAFVDEQVARHGG